jgi:predicted fused transcriptional regulator/phosphomethylpyrimidine kinase
MLGGGGGGPGGPDMENRVAKLEQAMASIDKKLDRIPMIEAQIIEIKAQMAKATDVAELKGQLSQMPKATEVANIKSHFKTDFGNLKADVAKLDGRVSNLPTMWQMILGFIGIMLAILWKTK